MKLLNIVLVGLFAISNSYAQKATIYGDVKGLKGDMVIYYKEGGKAKESVIPSVDGKFKWVAEMPEPQLIHLSLENKIFDLYVESSQMHLKADMDSLSNLKLSGSKIQEEANAYTRSMATFDDKKRELVARYKTNNKDSLLLAEQDYEAFKGQYQKAISKYVEEHPSNHFSLILVSQYAINGGFKETEEMFNKLSPNLKASPEGQLINERLAVIKRSQIGVPIINFTQKSADGKIVRFSDYKGKYVLVDFWASWCAPCRAENPNILRAYNKYKDKNFTVLAISLDDKEANWKKAIKEDNLPWMQLSDLKGFKNEVSSHYGISAIPSTLLVDPNGMIIARDLRGESLNVKLTELFGK